MKISSEISIDIEVGDYLEAADHQKNLEEILRQIRKSYPKACLTMRERRAQRVRVTDVGPRGEAVRYGG